MRNFKKIKDKKRFFTISAIIFFVFVAFFYFTSKHYSIAIAQQYCFPERLWIIEKGKKDFNYEDYVTFIGKNIPYYKDGIRWTKKVLGKPGDRVEIIYPKQDMFVTVTMNNMQLKKRVRAVVTIRRKDGFFETLYAFDKDTKGRELGIIKEQIIPEGYYFVYSPHERSYDSRYWGLISEKQIIGKAHPII